MLTALFRRYSANARQNRGRLFQDRLRPTDADRIVDLGGGTGDHFAAILPFRANVTVADLSADDLAQAARRHGFKTLQFDGADDRLPFEDQEIDIVFCSSVLEHVTGPKDDTVALRDGAAFAEQAWAHQQRFAAEIRRVAKRYFVQTPNRYFIVESHTWLPGAIVALPRATQVRVIEQFNRFWPKKTEPDWHLLTFEHMRRLFPDAAIVRERSLGLTKSLIAIKN